MSFSIKKAFMFTLNLSKKNFLAVFSFPAVCFLLKFSIKILTPSLFEPLELIIEGIVLLSITNVFLPFFSKQKTELKNYFPNYKKIIKFFIGEILLLTPAFISIVFGMLGWSFLHYTSKIVVAAGIIIFILSILIAVKAIIIIVEYLFFYINLLNGDSILSSFKNSAKLTFGTRNKLFSLFLLELIIVECLLDSPILYVFLSPLSALLFLHIYMQLLSKKMVNK